MPEIPDPAAGPGAIPQASAGPASKATAATDLTFGSIDLDQPPHGLHFIFFGRDGLRAGWGLLLFLVLFLAFIASGSFLLQQIHNRIHGHPPIAAARPQQNHAAEPAVNISPQSDFANEGLTILCVALSTWVMAKIEGRRVSAYGFDRQRRLRNFCAGLAAGVAMLSLLIVLLRATGLLVFDARLLFGRSILRYALIWLAGFLMVGVAEESIMRAYVQFTFARGLGAIYRLLLGETRANALGFWTAAVILSFAFGFGHRTNPGESPLGLVSAGLAGLLFCFSLWRTGSLWWAIGFHATWDWAQSFLYGVPDSGLMVRGHLFATHPVGRPILSGGITGPEGSILLLPVLIVAVVIVYRTLPRTHGGYPAAGAFPAPLD